MSCENWGTEFIGGKIGRKGLPVDVFPAEDGNCLDMPTQLGVDGTVVLREVMEWAGREKILRATGTHRLGENHPCVEFYLSDQF